MPPEGRYHHDRPKSVDTTYVIRKPIGAHSGHTEKTKSNGISTPPQRQRDNDRYRNSRPGPHVEITQNTGGYRGPEMSSVAKTPRPPPRALNHQKSQEYGNYHRFYPPITTNGLAQQQRHYPTIYKPIVTPLVIPAREITFTEPSNVYHKLYENPPSWQLNYDWRPFYQQTPIVLHDSGDLFFNSHQVGAIFVNILFHRSLTFHSFAYLTPNVH